MNVYVISSGQYLKIGLANSPTQRLMSLQTANPTELKLEYSRHFGNRKEARRVEREMHRRMKKYRKIGEWFECPIELVKVQLDKIADSDKPMNKSASAKYSAKSRSMQKRRLEMYLKVNASTDEMVEINKDTILCLMTSGIGCTQVMRKFLSIPYPLESGWMKRTYGKWVDRAEFLRLCDEKLKQSAKS